MRQPWILLCVLHVAGKKGDEEDAQMKGEFSRCAGAVLLSFALLLRSLCFSFHNWATEPGESFMSHNKK